MAEGVARFNVGLLRAWRRQGLKVPRILKRTGLNRNQYYYLINKSLAGSRG